MNKDVQLKYTFLNFLDLDLATQEIIRINRNHPSVRKVMYNTNEITAEDHRNFLNNLKTKHGASYWLVKKGENSMGVVSLVDQDSQKRGGELGYYLFPEYLESGIGMEFIENCLSFLFFEKGVKNIFGRTELNNKSALAVNYLLGFKRKDQIREINNVKYVEQECSLNDFREACKAKNNPKILMETLKNFNRDYKILKQKNNGD